MEEESQQSFLQEVGDTRKKLKATYMNLQNHNDLLSPKTDSKSDLNNSAKESESDVSIHLPVINDTKNKNKNGNETDKRGKKHPESKQFVESSILKDDSEARERIQEVEEKKHDTEALNEESEEFSKTNNDASGNNHIVFRKHAKPKVDSHWDHGDPIYEQIKSGFKSKLKIPDSSKVMMELKKLKQLKFITGNIPSSNVYIEDVRQRYNQSLNQKHENDTHPKVATRSGGIEKEKSVLNSDKMAALHPYTDADKTPATKVRVSNRNDKNSRIPVKVKTRSKQSLFDPDEGRLENDKKIIGNYQHYMDTKGELPHIAENKPRNNDRNNHYPKTPRCKLCSINSGSYERSLLKNKQSPVKRLEHHHDEHSLETEKGPTKDGYNDSGSRYFTESVELQQVNSSMPSTPSRRSEVPIGKAVEIVRSRHKFYEDNLKHKVMISYVFHPIYGKIFVIIYATCPSLDRLSSRLITFFSSAEDAVRYEGVRTCPWLILPVRPGVV